MNGFSRFEGSVKALMALACLTSYLPESVLGILCQDDRLSVVYTKILDEIKEELAFVHAIIAEVFDFISTGMCFVCCYVDQVHTGVAIAAATIRKGLDYMDVAPFSLCIGNAEANLSDFKGTTEPTEDTARNRCLLARLDFNPSMLVAGIARLREMEHSSMTCEQAHAAGCVYIKLHGTYTQETMRCRSFAYQLKSQLSEPPETRAVQRLQLQLQKVQKSNPNKTGAHQAFVNEMETLAQKRKQTNALGMSKHLSRVIIEKSGSVYSQYSV